MTPEERALKIYEEALAAATSDDAEEFPYLVIARAIRAAENDAYERAAVVADQNDNNEHSDFGAGASDAAERIAAAIRALKKKTDAPGSRGGDSGGAVRGGP